MKPILLSLALMVSACGPVSKNSEEELPTTNLTKREAMKIGIPAINKTYPGTPSDLDWFEAWFSEGIWTIGPKLPKDAVGGGASAEVSDADGTVIRTMFTE